VQQRRAARKVKRPVNESDMPLSSSVPWVLVAVFF
jgi:hypothetical protein